MLSRGVIVRELLKIYAECSNSTEIIAAQTSYLEAAENEKLDNFDGISFTSNRILMSR